MDPARARELLEAERARLLAILEDAEGGDHTFGQAEQERDSDVLQPEGHPADAAQEIYEAEQQDSVREHARNHLAEVEHAFAKLEDGTYGRDESSGEPIPDERLEALPAARYTVENQRLDEARADIPSRAGGDPTATRLGGGPR